MAAVVPVGAGLWGVVHAQGSAGDWSTSQMRYLSGLLLAIGLVAWTIVPDIEEKTGRFRLLTSLVLIGGLCRLFGVMTADHLSSSIGGALAMELAVTPLLCLWQARCNKAVKGH